MKTLQIRISDEDKKAADNILDRIGLDMPTAIRIYLKKIVITKSIPFELDVKEESASLIEVDKETQDLMDEVVSKWHKRNK